MSIEEKIISNPSCKKPTRYGLFISCKDIKQTMLYLQEHIEYCKLHKIPYNRYNNINFIIKQAKRYTIIRIADDCQKQLFNHILTNPIFFIQTDNEIEKETEYCLSFLDFSKYPTLNKRGSKLLEIMIKHNQMSLKKQIRDICNFNNKQKIIKDIKIFNSKYKDHYILNDEIKQEQELLWLNLCKIKKIEYKKNMTIEEYLLRLIGLRRGIRFV